jgi:hypothetical protein
MSHLGMYLDCHLNWKPLWKFGKINWTLHVKMLCLLSVSRSYEWFISLIISYNWICYYFLGLFLINEKYFCSWKRTIRAMLRLGSRSSYKEKKSFKSMGIVTVYCLYIYALMMFLVRNRYIYQTNNVIHNINTRQQEKLHVSSVRFSLIKRGVLYSSITIYNNLPQNIQILKEMWIFSAKL